MDWALTLLQKFTIKNRLLFGYLLLFIVIMNVASAINFLLIKEVIEKAAEKKLSVTSESITNNIENTANITIRNYLRSISEQNYNFINYQYQRYLKGELSEEEAKQSVADHFVTQTIGRTGYPYIVDSDGEIKVHPKPSLINVSLAQYAFIREQVERKHGYLEYDWQNPDEDTSRPKALYMTYFEPWDWIITSSSYREEFISLINIKDFSAYISSMSFDESGYSYVLNSDGDFIVHPFYSGNFFSVKDSEGQLFVQDILDRKEGKITYTWKNPHESEFREKVAVFRYLPELNWYVVSSAYIEELYQPANMLTLIHGFELLFTIIVLVPSTLLLSGSIVLPLKEVMSQVKVASSGDYSTRIHNHKHSNDELAQLSRYFNNFMGELEKTNAKLINEISEKTKAQQKQYELNVKLEQMNQNLEATVSERTAELEESLELLQRTQQQLIESEKLSALGGLVNGVAHEINTPLGISITASSLISDVNNQLKQHYNNQELTSEIFTDYIEQQYQAIRLLDDNLNRAKKLVSDFKLIAVDQISERKSDFAIIEVLTALTNSMHAELIKVPVELRLLGDENLRMSSYPGVLSQVISHLVLNSITHAFGDTLNPEITIEVEKAESNVIIRYLDNGCGVSGELHERIFEPFFTSNRGSSNTGLGLNLVYNMVTQKLKGSLNFSSTANAGVELVLELPNKVD